MTLKNQIVMSLTLMSFIGLTSCQETDADRIGDAQLCLDKANASTAQACLSKIEGIESAQANILRCSAGFLSEGFDDIARLVDSFSQLESGGDGTIGLLTVMAFKSKADGATNKSFASTTNSYCQKSKQKGLSMLGTMAMSATTLAAIAIPGLTLGSNLSAAQIEQAITDLLGGALGGSAELLAEIGNAVTATYQTACAAGSQANSDLCGEMSQVINDSNVDINIPQAVAEALLTLWKQP